ncbi:MAG: hypothetical protein ACMXYM_00515 [Candidatus Woesearchaeota archaeon]
MKREQLIALVFGSLAVLIGTIAWIMKESEEAPSQLGSIDPKVFLLGAVVLLLIMRIVLWRIMPRANDT